MSTTSLVISAVQSGIAYTSNLNNALAALNSCHSGATAPTQDVVTGKLWLDTAGVDPVLKVYRSGWRPLFTITSTAVNLAAGTVSATGSVTGNTVVSTTSVSGASGAFTGTVTAADFNTTSDARLKSGVQTLEDALETVLKLRGVSYTIYGDQSIGVIAQEVEAVIPEVVHTDVNGYKSVAYGNLVGLLIEAIKEQETSIASLTARLEILEARV